MRSEELMKKDVVCVSPTDNVEAAARFMRDEDVGFLPICDESRKVVGTLTDRDIAIRLVAEGKPASTPVKDIMSQDVVAARAQDDLREVERLMMQYQKSRIVITDDNGKLEGVISLSDIAQAEQEGRVAEVMRDVTEREAPPVH